MTVRGFYIGMDPGLLISAEFTSFVWFAIAFAGMLIALAFYRRSRSGLDASEKPALPTGTIVYRDTPTVRLSDSQHFDRLRKTASLRVGKHVDIVQAHPLVGPRFRITLHGIVMHGASEAAHISVIFNGHQVSCGPLGKEVGYNEFYIPRAARDESRSAVFFYNESGHALEFMRVKIAALDANAQTAGVEAMQMRGNWPGSEA
jgi:hypothetical protein